MDPVAQLELAERLRNHRAQLARVVDEITARNGISQLERELLDQLFDGSVAAAERQLIADATRRLQFSLLRPLGLAKRVARSWRPRLGSLRHYPPRALAVPGSYSDAKPPTPAPRISIVTPSFGQGHFLERTIFSVVGQGYPALEYVVQDGGSTDQTPAILRRYDPLISSWASEPDGGQADAINRGFDRTNGEIMGYLNSDDLLLPGSLAYVARYFAEHPQVDVVYGNRLMIDGDDGEIGSWILPGHDDEVLTLADYVPQETLFWRRRVWEAAGGRVDPSFGYALDWDLLLRFRAVGATMVHLPRFLGAFRIHDQQKTTADEMLGEKECAQLREREHGRRVPLQEVIVRQRRYMRRHVAAHLRYRVVQRLGRAVVPVQTLPDGDSPTAGRREALQADTATSTVRHIDDRPAADTSHSTLMRRVADTSKHSCGHNQE